MDIKPLFSIIVTVYNKEKYIENCLDSITHQTFNNYEIVLVDDGSTDMSASIYEKYSLNSHKFKIIYQNNQGHSSARNKGIINSIGDYVMFVDADDYLCNNNALEILSTLLIKNQIDIITTNFNKPKGFTPICGSGLEVLCKMIENKYYHSTMCSRIYRRDLIMDNSLFFKKLICDDEEWTPKIFAISKSVCEVDLEMYKRVANENSVTGTKSEYNLFTKGKDRVLAAKYLLDFFKDYDFESSNQLELITKHSLSLYIGAFSFYNKITYKKYKYDLWKILYRNKYLLQYMKYTKKITYKLLLLFDKIYGLTIINYFKSEKKKSRLYRILF